MPFIAQHGPTVMMNEIRFDSVVQKKPDNNNNNNIQSSCVLLACCSLLTLAPSGQSAAKCLFPFFASRPQLAPRLTPSGLRQSFGSSFFFFFYLRPICLHLPFVFRPVKARIPSNWKNMTAGSMKSRYCTSCGATYVEKLSRREPFRFAIFQAQHVHTQWPGAALIFFSFFFLSDMIITLQCTT